MKTYLMLLFMVLSIISCSHKTITKKTQVKSTILKTIRPNKLEAEFLVDFFKGREAEDDSKYYYLSKSSSNTKEFHNKIFSQDTIADLGASYRRKRKESYNFIVLTAQEKQKVNACLKLFDTINWNSRLVRNENRIKYAQKNTRSQTYTICKPIFLRNNSLCVFEYGYYCGNRCGEGSLAFYYKIDGKWKEWMVLVKWES
ncbi:hypothetical protein ACXZ1K_13320 [Pedobacter sp. PWIIR3]